jgi:hypothetical protein
MTHGKYRHTRKERDELMKLIRNAFLANNELEFMQILRRQGVKDEDPRFSAALKKFRELRSGKT